MNRNRGSSSFEALEILLTIFMVMLIFWAVFGNVWSCGWRWEDSGYKSRWSFGVGCQVQRKDGTWVPESTMREVM